MNNEIVKQIIQKEIYKLVLNTDLPKNETTNKEPTEIKEIETKSLELIENMVQVVDLGIRLYGAYQLGEFLGKVANRFKQNNINKKIK